LCLIERDAVITLIDAREHVAGGNVLVVGHGNHRNVAGDLRGDGELPGRDEGVIGRLKMPGVVPVEVSAGRRQYEEDKADHEPKRMPPHKPAAGLIPARTILPPRLLAFWRYFHASPPARGARWRRPRARRRRIIRPA